MNFGTKDNKAQFYELYLFRRKRPAVGRLHDARPAAGHDDDLPVLGLAAGGVEAFFAD